MFKYPFVLAFGKPFVSAFYTDMFDALPPVTDKLLVWANGPIDNGTERRDSYKTIGDFPMRMVQGACLSPDGSTDHGTTPTNHGTIVSYGGTSTLGYDGTTITMTAGTVWALLFSDGTFFSLAETSPTANTCFSTDGLHYITLSSGNLTALRSGRQDEYFRNAVSGDGKGENRVKESDDLSGYYSTLGTIHSTSATDPLGGNTACHATTGTSAESVDGWVRSLILKVLPSPANGETVSVWMKGDLGGESLKINNGGASYAPTLTLTDQWVRYTVYTTYAGSSLNFSATGDAVSFKFAFLSKSFGDTGEIKYIKTQNYTLDGTELLPFLNDEKGNTWNNSEQLQVFKKTQVGTAALTTEILLPFTVPAESTLVYSGTATATLDISNNKITFSVAGSFYAASVLDSSSVVLAKYAVDEGAGAILADSSGNGNDAAISAVLVDFWANKIVPQQLLNMDAPYNFFFDGVTGEPTPRHETEIDAACNVNNQWFMRNCVGYNKEYMLMTDVLVGTDLSAMNTYCCI